MSINFTGIKNVGSIKILLGENNQEMDVMSLQVTNDEKGNDLDEFLNSINKSGHPEDFKTAYSEGLISINVAKEPKEEEYEPDKYHFYLNGNPLEVNDENLPVFSYLAKLTTKISNTEYKDFKVTNEYIKSKDFVNGTSVGYFLKKIFMENPRIDLYSTFLNLHNPNKVRNSSSLINSYINDTMIDYFG